MKVQVQKSVLLQGVQTVGKAVSNKAILPVLTGIKLEVKGDKIRFYGNDLELGIECELPVEGIEEAGQIVLPGKAFQDIVKKLPDTVIELETHENDVIIRYYLSEISLKGFDPAEFPTMPTLEGERLTIPVMVFKSMIRKTIIAVSTDEARPVFTGVLLECENGDLKVIATDTHRLAFAQATSVVTSEASWKAIVPARALNEVLRLVPEDATLELTVNDNQALFSFDGITLVTRLIAGAFPDYRRVIPQDEKSKVTLQGKSLFDAVERASLVVDRIGLKFAFTEKKVEINAQAETGKVREEVELSREGEDVNIVFNQRFLTDVLKVVNSEEITLGLNGSFGPGVLKAKDADDYLYLMLPLRGAA